ncbi:hypothetical protein EJB05_29403, partial [Eragrostis curvula]
MASVEASSKLGQMPTVSKNKWAQPTFGETTQADVDVDTFDAVIDLTHEKITVSTPPLCTKTKLMPSGEASSKHVQMSSVSEQKWSQANIGETTQAGVNGVTMNIGADFEDESWLCRNDDWHTTSTSDLQNLDDIGNVTTHCLDSQELQRARWCNNTQCYRKRKRTEEGARTTPCLDHDHEVFDSGIWEPGGTTLANLDEDLDTHDPGRDDMKDFEWDGDDEERAFTRP